MTGQMDRNRVREVVADIGIEGACAGHGVVGDIGVAEARIDLCQPHDHRQIRRAGFDRGRQQLTRVLELFSVLAGPCLREQRETTFAPRGMRFGFFCIRGSEGFDSPLRVIEQQTQARPQQTASGRISQRTFGFTQPAFQLGVSEAVPAPFEQPGVEGRLEVARIRIERIPETRSRPLAEPEGDEFAGLRRDRFPRRNCGDEQPRGAVGGDS